MTLSPRLLAATTKRYLLAGSILPQSRISAATRMQSSFKAGRLFSTSSGGVTGTESHASTSTSVTPLQQAHHHPTTSYSSTTYTSKDASNRVADSEPEDLEEVAPLGSKAFVECDREALIDLFHKYAIHCDESGKYLDKEQLGLLLKAVGENLDPPTLQRLFEAADLNGDGNIELHEFLHGSDVILGSAPAGIVLVVGGPGSGKGVLSERLVKECGVVHLSSGDLLRDEVRRDTYLGREVRDIPS